MESGIVIAVAIGLLIFLIAFKGIKLVPQQEAWVIENLGRFESVLEPGLNFLIPFMQSVAYKFSLKEQAIDVHEQVAITQDNVSLRIDGVIYVRILSAKHAAYGAQDPYYAITQLAQTSMRSEIGKISLDRTFEERESLNANIVRTINEASEQWGIQCMRYEIQNITPPPSILEAMELQMTAERRKRAQILDSEGTKTAQINSAEADKQQTVLASEAAMLDQVNRAKGEAEAILSIADATAKGLITVGEAIEQKGGREAMNLKVAEQYVEAFSKLAKTNNTILLPADMNNPTNMIAQAMSVINAVKA
ncbi:MAG: regulator of protease activity HflC (stomatin/prohibitin superfamily) [Alphaproteobacteria bacterium]|jgi:regulator of protease activity HflC (stomatin/prohibitin superfamily)